MNGQPHHRATLTWRWETVQTLADLIPARCRVLSIGINPSPVSVAAGHYYQGTLGKRFYARLRAVGAYKARDGRFEDDLLFERGFGFTDIVKKPSRGAVDLTAADYAHGLDALRAKIARVRPALVLFTYNKDGRGDARACRGHGIARRDAVGGARVPDAESVCGEGGGSARAGGAKGMFGADR